MKRLWKYVASQFEFPFVEPISLRVLPPEGSGNEPLRLSASFPRVPTDGAQTFQSGRASGKANKCLANNRKIKMKIQVLVIGDTPNEYTGKRGLVKQQILACVEAPGQPEPLTQVLEYPLTDDEKDEFAGKSQGKTLTLAVRELTPFGGKLRVRGHIVRDKK